MPLYEFECEKCHHRFERIQSVAAPDPKCPKCESKVERLLHAPAVQFKGSGWYATDYAKKAPSGTSDSKSSEKSEGSGSSTKDSKPDSKPAESKSDTKSSPSSKE